MTLTIPQHVPNTGAGANATFTWPGATTAGDLLVVVFGIKQSLAGVTLPTGYAQDKGQNIATSGDSIQIASKIASGSETTETFTNGANAWSVEAWQLHDSAGGTWSVDQVASKDMGSGATNLAQCTTGISPTVSDSIAIVGTETGNDNGGSEAISSSFTVEDAATFIRLIAGDKIKTTNAAENPQVTWATARIAGIVLANYKSVGGGGGGSLEPRIDRTIPRATERGLLRGVA